MNDLITYEKIQECINDDFTMIIAKTHTCGACKSISSLLENNVPSLSSIITKNVFIDDMEKFRGDHLIFTVPTILIFSKGKELLRESRYIDYSKIERLITLYRD